MQTWLLAPDTLYHAQKAKNPSRILLAKLGSVDI